MSDTGPRGGPRTPPETPADLAELQRMWTDLTPEQRAAVLGMVRAMAPGRR